MRHLIIAASLCVFTSATTSLSQQSSFSVKLSTKADVFKRRETVQIFIHTSKTSHSLLVFGETGPLCDYHIEVRGVDGRPARMTKEAAPISCDEGRSLNRNITVRLLPGESNEDSCELSSLYDMLASGVYLVRVGKTIKTPLGSETDYSDLFPIRVGDPE